MATLPPNLVTFGDQCPPNPCAPCDCPILGYAAQALPVGFAPLYIDPATPINGYPYKFWLTKTINSQRTVGGSTTNYSCVITVNPLNNDVTIEETGDVAAAGSLDEILQSDAGTQTFAPDSITVDGTDFNGVTVIGSITLTNPYSHTGMQADIDYLLAQLTWPQVKAQIAIFQTDPAWAGYAPGCSLIVNWLNHFSNGNGLPDASWPWVEPGNVSVDNFFASPMPRAIDGSGNCRDPITGALINPFNSFYGATTLQVLPRPSQFDGVAEAIIGIAAFQSAGNTFGLQINTADLGLTASQLLIQATQNYCDDLTTEQFSNGTVNSPTETRTNVTLTQGQIITRPPFVWSGDYEYQEAILHHYTPGNC